MRKMVCCACALSLTMALTACGAVSTNNASTSTRDNAHDEAAAHTGQSIGRVSDRNIKTSDLTGSFTCEGVTVPVDPSWDSVPSEFWTDLDSSTRLGVYIAAYYSPDDLYTTSDLGAFESAGHGFGFDFDDLAEDASWTIDNGMRVTTYKDARTGQTILALGYQGTTGKGFSISAPRYGDVFTDWDEAVDYIMKHVSCNPEKMGASTSVSADTGTGVSSATGDASAQSNSTTSPSMSQSNALSMARSYLKSMPYSHDGLIDQLEYSGFSSEDATYGADSCGADWNAQALSMARSYLQSMPYSYKGLVDQLEYSKFTTEQATYGADNCGADWTEQADRMAQSYLNSMPYSRSGLIDQLEYSGFTADQATHGATSAGL